jgi:L-ascorbate metabolism protein UlaG (beta-lactamase superfamily)
VPKAPPTILTDSQRRIEHRLERARASPQYADGVFRNTSGALPMSAPSLSLMGEFFFGSKAERRPSQPLAVDRPHETWARAADTGFRTTWLGHSTLVLELDGHRVLTDPVFGERASPLSFAGPRRFHPVPARLAELPALDAVLLSHDHYDHLCKSTMEALARTGVPVVTALGVGARLERFGFAPELVTELDWNQSVDIGGLRFTATPAQHFSGRSMNDRNRTLWASWVIQGGRRKVFFSGDTGLTDELAVIGRDHGPFDLVMLEIGAFHPAWGTIHLGPDNALTAFDMLGGGTLLPVHWGTFDLGLHPWREPGEILVQRAADRGVRIITPRVGSAVEPERLDGPTPWWRPVAEVDVPILAPEPAR